MTPEALLGRLGEAGVNVRLSGRGRIALAPSGRIPDELRQEVIEQKLELADLLEARQPPSETWADLGPPPMERPPSDPRPDLEADSLAWAQLLAYASTDRADPWGLYGVVHGARCGGALLRFANCRWRIEPRIDPTERVSIWHDAADWEADRGRYLLPHRERLTVLLRLLPTPSRLSAPPVPLPAAVAALRALGWNLARDSEDNVVASNVVARHPTGGSSADALWIQAHLAEIGEMLRGERE